MAEYKIALGNKSLDEHVSSLGDDAFPDHDQSRGELSYPDRYNRLKESLLPIHQRVELGAFVESALEYRKRVAQAREEDAEDESAEQLSKLREAEPFTYLNNHGLGHVRKVIAKASELLRVCSCKIDAWGYPFNRSASRPPSVFGRRPPRPVCPWAFQARGPRPARARDKTPCRGCGSGGD